MEFTRADFRELSRLALPMVLAQVGMLSMGAVDTIMAGHLSAIDLAAVGLGNLYFFAVAGFGMGTLFSLDPVISQAVGAGETVAVARGIQRGFVLALFLGLALMPLLVPAAPVLTWLRQPSDVVLVAAGYVRASIPGLFPFLGYIVLRQALQSLGRLRAIVWAVLLANLANVFFNWVLVYGNLGAPRMGAVGTGWATTASRVVLLAILVGLARNDLRPYLRPLRRDVLQAAPLLRMLRLGVPIGGQFTLEFGAFAFIGLLMGTLGTIPMAGHQVALNLAALAFMVPWGVAQASAVLVGRAVGSGEPARARAAGSAGLVLGGGFMCITALVFLLLPELLARVYTTEPAVIALVVVLLPVAGVFQVFDGLQVVAMGILRGLGDTRWPMLISVVGFWVVGMPISVFLGFRTKAGPVGLWWGLAAGLAAVAILLLRRARVRLGRPLQRVVIDDPAADATPAPT